MGAEHERGLARDGGSPISPRASTGSTPSADAGADVITESFVRVFVEPAAFKATIRAYMAATGGHCSMYFPFPERGLELAAVSSPAVSFLIIAGDAAALAPFRATQVTFHVDDLDEAIEVAVQAGATLLQPRTAVPTGVQARLRFADGLTVEYVEHDEAARRFYTDQPLDLD